jgi:hypothetical protein
MSWGDWINLGIQAYSAYSGNRAARDGGKQAQQGAQASNDLMKWMYEQDIKRQQPFYNTSVSADSRLSQLLGLGGGGGSSANTLYYDTNPDGTPIARADLYANNPQYRAAWDQALKQHQNQWRVGYHANSDRNMIQGQMESALGKIQQPSIPSQQQSQQAAFDAFRNTPGYQFGLDEGRKTLEASAAAAGGLNSGATLRALTRYGQGYADQQGYRPYVSDLMQLSGRGQAQASQMGNQGMQYASQMGANLQNAANARAQSTYQQNQNLQQGLGALSGWLGYMGGNRSTGGNQRPTGADAFGYGYGW